MNARLRVRSDSQLMPLQGICLQDAEPKMEHIFFPKKKKIAFSVKKKKVHARYLSCVMAPRGRSIVCASIARVRSGCAADWPTVSSLSATLALTKSKCSACWDAFQQHTSWGVGGVDEGACRGGVWGLSSSLAFMAFPSTFSSAHWCLRSDQKKGGVSYNSVALWVRRGSLRKRGRA